MLIKNKNARFGRYPSCDMLNNALRFLLDGKPNIAAIKEIVLAINKANGYIYEDLSERIKMLMGWED